MRLGRYFPTGSTVQEVGFLDTRSLKKCVPKQPKSTIFDCGYMIGHPKHTVFYVPRIA